MLSHVSGMQQSHYGVLRCVALLVRSVFVTQHLWLSSCSCVLGPRSATMTCSATSAAAMYAQQRAASVSALTVCIQHASGVAEC